MSAWPDPRAGLIRGTSGAATEDVLATSLLGGRGGSGDENAAGKDNGARAAALTLDDLILRRASGGGDAGGGVAKAEGGAKKLTGTLFSRAPLVVTGWDNPHDSRRGDGRRGDDRVVQRALGGDVGHRRGAADMRGAGHPPKRETHGRDKVGRVRQPTELAGQRNAVGVVRDYVDYNAGYLSPDEVNADMEGPPSPVRGFAQRLMSLDDGQQTPSPRGKHSRKRVKTNRSADPEGSYAYEQNKKRSRRQGASEAEALLRAARRMPTSPMSPVAPGSASRSGRALRAPQEYWSRDARTDDTAANPKRRGPGRPRKDVKSYSPPSSEDEYEEYDVEEDDSRDEAPRYNRHRSNGTLGRTSRTASHSNRREAAQHHRTASGTRKGKPGPKPGLAAAKKAAMIAAGIPVPVLPPGVKRGRGRPPRSMLVIPDGPTNANLPESVLRSLETADPRLIGKLSKETSESRRQSHERRPRHAPVDDAPTACVACGRVDGEDRMLLCDGCDRGYHTHCLVPRLDVIPENEWFCYECMTQNRPKTAAAEAFERRQADKARLGRNSNKHLSASHDGSPPPNQRFSNKIKLNGERKLKPGPKPKIKRGEDEYAYESARVERKTTSHGEYSHEKRSVGRPRKDPNAWSDEQLEALQKAQVEVHLGRKNFWTEVASYVPGKSAKQCKEKVYAGLDIGGDGEMDAEEEEDLVRETAITPADQRTLATPTKPNTANENAERWRNRRVAEVD